MIRKPREEDFREGQAVRALRETRRIGIAGAEGVAVGLHRLVLLWLGGVMAFGFTISLIGATGGVALIPLGIGGFLWWRSRRENEAARMAVLRSEPERLARAVSGNGGTPAFPPEVRRQGTISADIAAVTQQAFTLFAMGFLMMLVLRFAVGSVAIITGMGLVVLAVLIASRLVGDRKLIEWDTRKVKVWHLLSEGEMQWSDVVDVSLERAGWRNLAVFFQSGTRRNIVLTAAVNRLGGPTTLRVPIRYMNLPPHEVDALLRDLLCWRAAGHAAVAEAAPPAAGQSQPQIQRGPITPLTDPRESFDPDAIMARYLRERQELQDTAARERATAAHPMRTRPVPTDDARPVFGRKRA